MSELDYDLRAALECNSLAHKLEEIDRVLLEITGEADEAQWHWILALKDGRFAYVTGGCDYTGWDCQSDCDWFDDLTLDGAFLLAPIDVQREFSDMQAKGETQRGNTGGLR